MSIETLAESVHSLPAFQRAYAALALSSVASQFPSLVVSFDQGHELHDWAYLLKCASVLCQSLESHIEEAALRIAQECLVSAPEEYHDAACVILTTLTNRAAVALAERRQLVQSRVESRLPLKLRLDWFKREISQTVTTSDGQDLLLNRFQLSMWRETEETDYLSVSAPTSSGKSFVLCHWLADYLLANPRAIVVYIVPTRALIQQVEIDLRRRFDSTKGLSVNVSSVPLGQFVKEDAANVFVFTQERLHIFLTRLKDDQQIGVLVVDEAHKVGDGARGVLLQHVIDVVAERSINTRIIFASPLVSNPESLLEILPNGRRKLSIGSKHVSVNQNLLWASQVPRRPQDWSVELCSSQGLADLGKIRLVHRPTSALKRLAFVADAMSDPNGGNLIYVNRAADAEDAALLLWGLAGAESNSVNDDQIKEVIKLAKHIVHSDYVLATVLERRIAFHYGNMPLLLKSEIERLFRENVIRYLVCTSTLVEGVNLPCKSIFVRGPRKGVKTPMGPSDFWNLAGRAGRLGKEFQGNIICIDPRLKDVWPLQAPLVRVESEVKTASAMVFEDVPKFVAYIHSETPNAISSKRPDYDQLLSHLIATRLRNDSLKDAPICNKLNDEQLASLDDAVSGVLTSIEIPESIIIRNPGISPFAMQNLLNYFQARTEPVEELVPVFPESDDAVSVYTAIFFRIDQHLKPIFGKRAYPLALLVVRWMRGYALSRLISDRIAYLTRTKKKYKLASTIRQVMEDVETYARFLVPKFLNCYLDILNAFLAARGRADLASTIPDVSVWLEFGASQNTQLSLMGLGLSRTSAVALSHLIVDADMNQDQALEWLRGVNLAGLNVPHAVLEDILKLIGRPELQATP